MKLDKIKFATLIGYISYRYAVTIDQDTMREMDEIIDIDVQPVPSGQIDPAALDRMIGLMMRGTEKIEAIKQYRLMTGFGLKDAKDAVEAFWVTKSPIDASSTLDFLKR